VLPFLLSCAAFAAQSADVSGEWDVTLNSPHGSRAFKASLRQSGETLKGAIGTQAEELQLEGTVKGKEVKVSYTVQYQGNPLVITLTGQLEGDTIKGSADFGGFAQGDWTATRASAAATAVAAGAAPAARATDEFTGDWDVTVNSPQGAFNFQASFKQDGEKLGGTIKSPRGELPFEGTVTAKQLKFSYTVPFQGNPLLITMTGAIDGDAIKGQADFGGFAQGDWTAKRSAPGASSAAPQAAAAPSPAEKVDVTGAWIFQVETSAGSGSPAFTFKQEGENLTGQYKGLFGEAPLTGTVKGNAISFSFKVNAQGFEGTVTYTGTVEKDSMKGTASLGDLGSGSFTAKRQ
jgi:hypothetical protein